MNNNNLFHNVCSSWPSAALVFRNNILMVEFPIFYIWRNVPFNISDPVENDINLNQS